MTTSDLFDFRMPAIISPRLVNHLFSDIEELFRKDQVGVPYDIIAHTNENNEVDYVQIIWALAGYDKTNINVSVLGDKLDVSVTKEDEQEDPKKQYWYRGITKRSLKSSFALLSAVDKGKINSQFKDGLLTVTLPLKQKEVIKVNVE